MDLAKIEQGSVEVPILHPETDKKTGLVFEIVSLDDDRVKAVEYDLRNKSLRKRKSISAQKQDKNSIELLAATVIGWKWEGDAVYNGEKPEFTMENVIEVLSDNDFIAKQVDEALGNEAAFFQN